MSNIWIPNKQVFCPLCHEPFKIMKMMYHGKVVKAYVCRTDKIFTFDFDLAFNKWFDTDKTIPCPTPTCNGRPMRWFSRYVDGYLKAVCTYCDIALEKDSDVQFTKDGLIELDEFQQNEPTEEKIYLPIDKLKIPNQKKIDLKNKMKWNREHGRG